MKRLFWERLAWLWVLCIPLAVAGGIGYGGQAYNPQSVAITGGTINIANSTNSSGITGVNSSTGYGVQGLNSSSGIGVYGSNSGSGIGVVGTNSGAGDGVFGGNSSTGIGVDGSSASTGTGVYGSNPGTGYGVYGYNSSAGIGVYGYNTGTGYGGAFDKLNVTNYLSLNGNLIMSATAPTISSGFGTSPSITFNNGTAAFYVNVGTGGTASAGSINMNVAAPHYWSCAVTIDNDDLGTGQQTILASIGNQILTFKNVTISTGAVAPWTGNDVFFVNCISM